MARISGTRETCLYKGANFTMGRMLPTFEVYCKKTGDGFCIKTKIGEQIFLVAMKIPLLYGRGPFFYARNSVWNLRDSNLIAREISIYSLLCLMLHFF